MPLRKDISSVLLIGAGPIIIGQACEFDYSGTQALKALKEEGLRVVLVNSNPATIMTDPQLADATYIEPIDPKVVAQILHKEKVDAILPTTGGQTALNCALSLKKSGILDELGVELIGASAEAIDLAEDRKLFGEVIRKLGFDTPRYWLANASDEKRKQKKLALENNGQKSGSIEEKELKALYVASAMAEAEATLDEVSLPVVIRPSFTLGGTGGGIARSKSEYFDIVKGGLEASPTTEVLIEESVEGWKEFEIEVVRDSNDSCIVVCSIENIDPMGVHTGDSITVAPALTLTDKEYQQMRSAAFAILRKVGVETGGANVQFAVNPENGRMIVIEMNPRVSRSSALASKATGFPIARVAAKLALGYTLDELKNDISGGTIPSSFEPAIDYVVIKIPRFNFEKFPGCNTTLTTSMKSVGEAMAIGRNFAQAFQKCLRSLEAGLSGFTPTLFGSPTTSSGEARISNAEYKNLLATPSAKRILHVAQCYRDGFDTDFIHEASKIDPWFLEQIKSVVKAEEEIINDFMAKSYEGLLSFKQMGFSDKRIASLANITEQKVREKRHKMGIRPVYKRIDSCAGEFKTNIAYMYSAYEKPLFDQFDSSAVNTNECSPSDKEKIVILGAGPNRIGQGIEFDYCCCHAAYALGDLGYETIMINCNPETVSTDFDTSDRLYFEPLSVEDVLEVLHAESAKGTIVGVIVQFGGQTPLTLAHDISLAGYKILGTDIDMIDIAEDRDRFKEIINELGLCQPVSAIAYKNQDVIRFAEKVGYPILLRPSYVLGGRAMEIVEDSEQLEMCLPEVMMVSGGRSVLIDQYLKNAIEVDVEAISDGSKAVVCGILEHIEEAGVHSGDSACCFPPHSLSSDIIEKITEQAKQLAIGLNVKGLINIQVAVSGDNVFVLEANPRASRTIPFLSKALGVPLAGIAAQVMIGKNIDDFVIPNPSAKNYCIKEAVFVFSRFEGSEVILGPEMKSTGEVMGIAPSFEEAFAKSQLGAGIVLPNKGTLFVSVKNEDKKTVLDSVQKLYNIGFEVFATRGTYDFLKENGLEKVQRVMKVTEGRPSVVDYIANDKFNMVINTTSGVQAIKDSFTLRQAAVKARIPYYTTTYGSVAAMNCIASRSLDSVDVLSLQEHHSSSGSKK